MPTKTACTRLDLGKGRELKVEVDEDGKVSIDAVGLTDVEVYFPRFFSNVLGGLGSRVKDFYEDYLMVHCRLKGAVLTTTVERGDIWWHGEDESPKLQVEYLPHDARVTLNASVGEIEGYVKKQKCGLGSLDISDDVSEYSRPKRQRKR